MVSVSLEWQKQTSVISSNLKVRVPVIRSREEDLNRDGVADSLTISLNLPLRFNKSFPIKCMDDVLHSSFTKMTCLYLLLIHQAW